MCAFRFRPNSRKIMAENALGRAVLEGFSVSHAIGKQIKVNKVRMFQDEEAAASFL